MNFPTFGNHFPSGVNTMHQFNPKFSHEGNTANSGSVTRVGVGTQTVAGVGTQTSLGEEPMRFNGEYEGEERYQRDSSTQVSGSLLQESPPQPQQKYHHQQYQYVEEKRYQEKQEEKKRDFEGGGPTMPPTWQSIATPGSTVADYLSHLPASTLPISLHHFLKYSAESIKKDAETSVGQQEIPSLHDLKKKKKKKPPKEKKPRPKPGEIRMTTALDGSTLYCCPECHIAYPDKSLLEQHLLTHTLERRFFCDVCGAGLKRKDHLTRHRQSHNPERPFVCTVCMKAFKRKEQLTLHFVIHSGEKRHVCTECGKGFYRKDHLRKHARSHIARRVKAELSQHVPAAQEVTS